MKTGKQRGGKASGQRGAEAPGHEQVRANLRLDAEVYRRLLIASVMENRPAGEIVSRMLAEYLKRWSLPSDLSARGKSVARDVESNRLDQSDEISLTVADMAA
jgi:hypothetical protein